MTETSDSLGWSLRWTILACVVWQFACAPSPEDRKAEVRALQSQGQFQQTVPHVENLREQSPDDPEVMRLYGVTMLAVDIPGLAIWPLRRLVEHPEGTAQDRILLARALQKGGAPIEAFEVVQEVVSEGLADSEETLVLHAALGLEAKDYEAVLSSSERLIEIDPVRRPLAHVWKGKALVGLDRFEEADEALEVASNTIAVRPDAESLRGTLCKVSIEVAEARDDDDQVNERTEECLENHPLDQEIFSGAVRYFDEKGERDRATAVLEKVVELAPRYLSARSQIAERLAMERRYDEAEALLLEATNDEEIRSSAWLAVADYHRKRENFDEAIQAAEQGLSGVESIPTIIVAQLADDCIQARRLDRAEQLIGEIDVPEYAELLRGRLELARGNPVKAREHLLGGLKLFTGNAAARYLAGQASEQLGELDRAIAEYRDAVRSGPGDSDAAFALARLYDAQGNYIAAHHMLGLRRVKMPEDIRTFEEVARLSIKYLNREGAQFAIDALDKLPSRPPAAVVMAGRLEARTDGPDAGVAKIVELTQERSIDLTAPEWFDVLRELVGFLGRSDRDDEGLEYARAAIAANPDFGPFHELLAEALIWADGPSEEIEATWTRALELDSKSARALWGMADLAVDAGRLDDALELFDRATEADRDDTMAAWRAIAALVASSNDSTSVALKDLTGDETGTPEGADEQPDSAKGDDAPALRDWGEEIDRRLDELLDRDPIHRRALNLRARRLATEGSDLDHAEELASRAVRFAGGVQALETLGLVTLDLGEYRRSIRAFRRALQSRPKSPHLSYQLGRALLASGSNDEAARAALNRALEGEDFPEAEDARKVLAELDAKLAAENENEDDGENVDES